MMLRRVFERGAVRLHLFDCGCGDPGCEHVVLMGNILPGELWLTVHIGPLADADAAVERVFDDPYLLAHGIALVGARRERLVGDRLECIRQVNAWLAVPDWVARVPIETVNEVREYVWGDAFMAVPAALQMLDNYVPDLGEGPVPARSMEMLIGRQMRVAYPPEKRNMS